MKRSKAAGEILPQLLGAWLFGGGMPANAMALLAVLYDTISGKTSPPMLHTQGHMTDQQLHARTYKVVHTCTREGKCSSDVHSDCNSSKIAP